MIPHIVSSGRDCRNIAMDMRFIGSSKMKDADTPREIVSRNMSEKVKEQTHFFIRQKCSALPEPETRRLKI
jgi:hypothetical protein